VTAGRRPTDAVTVRSEPLRPRRPVEPPPSVWRFPHPDQADDRGLVCVGGDLEPGTLLEAYRNGLFPMPLTRRQLGWWSPDPRGILPLDGLRVSRSLRKSCARFQVRVDTAFRSVMEACGDPRRPHGWINRHFLDAYEALHHGGWAHSVEVFGDDGELAGGLYGVRVNGLFAGESMFHRRTDASKVALVALVDLLRDHGGRLLDVQWLTPHLASLGAVEIDRSTYLRRLADAVHAGGGWPPVPDPLGG
jgi:leucyl/phenylalanyl-tRNA---protein transferase